MLRGGWKFVQKKRELHLHINQHCLCGLSMRSMRGLVMHSAASRVMQCQHFAGEPGRSVWGCGVCRGVRGAKEACHAAPVKLCRFIFPNKNAHFFVRLYLRRGPLTGKMKPPRTERIERIERICIHIHGLTYAYTSSDSQRDRHLTCHARTDARRQCAAGGRPGWCACLCGYDTGIPSRLGHRARRGDDAMQRLRR
jgi:hypothetical protein